MQVLCSTFLIDFSWDKFLKEVHQHRYFADDLDRNILVVLHRMSGLDFHIGPTSQGLSKDVTVSVEAILGRLFKAWLLSLDYTTAY